MSAEILAPFGDYATPGAVEEVVERLRTLLAEAERGEIVGLAFVGARANRVVTYGWIAGTGDAHVLLSGASLVQHMIARKLDGDE